MSLTLALLASAMGISQRAADSEGWEGGMWEALGVSPRLARPSLPLLAPALEWQAPRGQSPRGLSDIPVFVMRSGPGIGREGR